jgi:hypothetical protein
MESSRRFRLHFSFMALVSLLLIGSLAGAQTIEAGYRDFEYPEDAGSNSKPTGEKPESKLWFNDGLWWGVLWRGELKGGGYTINRLDRTTQTWIETQTVVDQRSKARVDVGWDGTHLYVVAHIYAGTGATVTKDGDRGKLYRFSYDAGTQTYLPDAGFPVNVNSAKTETLVLAKDSTGRLWVTYVENGNVMVNHSLGDDLTWSTPFALPSVKANTLDKDDIASIIAYDGHVGIMWSRQTYNNLSHPTTDPNPHSGGSDCSPDPTVPTCKGSRVASDSDHLASITMNFAVHDDGAAPSAWSADAIYTTSGDDHINLKTHDGYVYAAFKEDGDAKVIGLLACKTQASGCRDKNDWKHYPVFKTRDNEGNSPQAHLQNLSQWNPTRPLVLIDTENRDLYVFVSLEQFAQFAIHYKKTKLDAINFDLRDPGVSFIRSATDLLINDPTSTKQNVNSTTGLVVLASDDGSFYYFHNDLALAKP